MTGFAEDRGVVALASGSREGVEVGDRFWMFREGGIHASGQIQFVSEEGSAGAVEGVTELKAGRPVTILKSAVLSAAREGLPPGVTLRGRIARVAPGRGSGWLDIGAWSGLKSGDTILVRRLTEGGIEVPLARGRITQVADETSLAVLSPIVSNAMPEPGDIAELWPSPADRRQGRVESMVLKTQPASEPEGDLLIVFAGTPEDGVEEKRLVDLFRGQQYIGHAAVAKADDPNSEALMFNAGRRQPARLGDRAWVRPPPGPPPRSLSAAIFQIRAAGQNTYALIAAGETDGVTIGETFVVRRADPGDSAIERDIAELTIEHVHTDFSTAIIRTLPGGKEPVRVWDFAERLKPVMPRWRGIGMIRMVVPESRSAVADLEALSTATVGRIVRCIPGDAAGPGAPLRPVAAAIVINRSGDEAVFYVPPGWGRAGDLANAQVELADAPPTTRPR